jgi:hypothetical protein
VDDDGVALPIWAELAGIEGTAARRARDILRETRQLLMQRLKISRAELESIVRLIESQMHVTMERILREG